MRFRFKPLLACITALGALIALFVQPSVGAAKSRVQKGWMVLFGSSSVNGSFGRLIEDDLGRHGFRVDRHGFSAAGLARPDFRDLREVVGNLPLGQQTTSVMLYIGGNDAQALWLRPGERLNKRPSGAWIWWQDSRWPSVYEARAIEFINSLCARGVQHTIVLPPADVVHARLQSRLERVRAVLARAARASECGRYLSTQGDKTFLDPLGGPLRTPDGVHMTKPGAQRVWGRVRESVLALVNRPAPKLSSN
jgi:hypothetical protein